MPSTTDCSLWILKNWDKIWNINWKSVKLSWLGWNLDRPYEALDPFSPTLQMKWKINYDAYLET